MTTTRQRKASTRELKRRLQADTFRALSDPVRLELVCRLACTTEPATVTELSECCGTHLSGVSRHLATLREAGLVHAEKRGREMRYRLAVTSISDTLRGLADAIDACRETCCGESK
jgi:DNA-binding transcriptional ArsR family regulator